MKNVIIAIETSCDDTCMSVVDLDRNIIFEDKITQNHTQYGGVYPEIASREHLGGIQILWKKLYTEDFKKKYKISHIAVTNAPGLVGSLAVGVSFAKGLGVSLNVPVFPVNHLLGHLFSCSIDNEVIFPCLFCLFSGGHTMIIHSKSWFEHEILSQTIDDSIGEGYDKVARMLGLGFPGGPIVEKLAKNGRFGVFNFKIPMIDDVNFSISGLKTAVLREVEKNKINEQTKADLCFGFQECVVKTIFSKIKKCKKEFKSIALVGGVSANERIRAEFLDFSKQRSIKYIAPKMQHTTDNATMIAFAGIEMLKQNKANFDLSFFVKGRELI